MNVFYSITPGLSIEPQSDGSVMVHTSSRKLRLEGPSVPFILNELFPLITGHNELAFIEKQLQNAAPGYLVEILPRLEEAGILLRSDYEEESATPEENVKMNEIKPVSSSPSLLTTRLQYALEELLHQPEVTDGSTLYRNLIHPQTGFIKNWTIVKKDEGEPAIPYVITAQFKLHAEEALWGYYCSGKGITLEQAEISAAGEAAERYTACYYSGEELICDSYNHVKEKALDPRKLILYLPEQYKNLPFKPFRGNTILGWVQAYSLVNEKPLLVPAISVYLDYRLQNENENFVEMNSSGLAAGSTLAKAIIAGTLELIERDAFMIAWYNRLPCTRIDIRSHPSPDIVELLTHYQQLGTELHLFKLPTDAPCHVFMAIAVGSSFEGPSFSVGLGSGFSSTTASTGALLELAQVRASSDNYYKHPDIRQRIKELEEDPALVATMDDHRLLYAGKDHSAAFDFLLNLPLTSFEWDKPQAKDPGQALTELVSYLREVGSDLIYYNLSMPITVRAGYYSCRVILPGFQPIHFGYNNMRLTGRRLYELPAKLGFEKIPSSPGTLHHYPHPLA